MNAFRLLFCALLVGACFLAQSCFSLKSNFQPTSYYKLVQKPTAVHVADTLPGTLYIRTFTTNEEYNNDHIVYYKEDSYKDSVRQVDYYIYHRWLSEMPDMVTDFIANRYIEKNIFRQGIVQTGSSLMPDYILEGKVLEMIADNGSDASVLVKLHISLVRFEPLSVERSVLLQRVYEARVPRAHTAPSSIATAYSTAFSDIADRMLADIASAVRSGTAAIPRGADTKER